MKFDAVLFDMDGVLINSEPCYFAEELVFYRDELGVPITFEQQCAMMGSAPAYNTRQMLNWYPELGISHEKLTEMHEQMLLRGIMRVESLVEGVENWIRDIRADGMKVAVASSSPILLLEYARERFRFDEKFDTVVCSRDVKNAKPAPDIFLEAARRVGAAPERCLVIEDSKNGVKAGVAAGMTVASFTGALMGEPAPGAHIYFDKYNDENYKSIVKAGPLV